MLGRPRAEDDMANWQQDVPYWLKVVEPRGCPSERVLDGA